MTLKHFFFDLDNTLMRSRTAIAAEHESLFKRLCEAADVIVVSGAQESQIRQQIPDSLGARFFVLGQTGNQAIDRDRNTLWKETFTEEQTAATLKLIEAIRAELDLTVKDPNDLVELRGAQISYSPIGHHEQLEKKYAFDPKTEKRRAILTAHAADVADLQKIGVDVVPGGTTCFDFFLAGRTKGFNVARLVEKEGWEIDESVYVGDALFPGGNDETVVGVVPTHPVAGPEETFAFIQAELGN
jgi:HAD superfamily hydrolase (TIGR01484 family)